MGKKKKKKKKHLCFVCGIPGEYVNLGWYKCRVCPDVSWRDVPR